ncbi:S-adenosyl-L-methionine-dependent methyltransferase [Fennellomyces sp. T-0311]|nr:S-adenosyl-L-methionine-dependent methyltransferase [Fennellomyces sp. T-0311]
MDSVKYIQHKPFLQFFTNLLESYNFTSPIKLLEVGCGPGHFSALLKDKLQDRVDITAIDTSELEITECAKHNVANTYIQARIEDLDLEKHQESFDVILFAKSLHHCDPLDETVEQAHRLLKNNGILVAEEFARENMNEASATWFFNRTDLLKAGDHLEPPSGQYAHKVERWHSLFDQSKGTPYQRWHNLFANHVHSYHGEQLAPTELITASLTKVFGEKGNLKSYDNQVFLSAMLVHHGLKPTDVGKAVLEVILSQEEQAIKDGSFKGLGVTFVVQKHT